MDLQVKRVKLKNLLTILSLLSLFGSVHAKIWYVHPDSLLHSINAALDSCADNDTVLVAASTYYGTIVWPNTQGIDLISESGPDSTILDGNSAGSVIFIFGTTNLDTTSIIRGFTIQNGYANDGGGIYCDHASPTIMGNIIKRNKAWYEIFWGYGGGIFCFTASPVITGNTIIGNLAGNSGGGIFCRDSSFPIINNNTITGDTAFGGSGGGIFSDPSCFLRIDSNSITNNSANSIYCDGGGVYCYSADLVNNTITNNYSGSFGGGIWCAHAVVIGNVISGNTAPFGGGIRCANATISHNTISGNTSTYGQGAGIHCQGWSPLIDSCTISNNIGDGLYCSNAANPIIHFCDIFDNTGYGIRNIDSTVIIDATYNWWGDLSGPYHPATNPNGLGDSVSDYVDYRPWLGDPVPVEEELSKKITFKLQIHPNPTSGKLSLNFALANPVQVKINLYDLSGRKVVTVHENYLLAGERKLSAILPNNLASGIYFLRFEAGDVKATKKVLLTR